MTITTIGELIETLENGEYSYYGLRGASEHDLELINSGRDYLDCSQDNWDQRDCEWYDDADMLSGTSAIGVNDYMGISEIQDRVRDAMGYAVNHHGTNTVLLIADANCEYGDDDKEVVLGSNGYGANIVAIVKIEEVKK